MVENAVKRIDRDEFHIIFALFSGQFKQIVEHKRGGDDRRPAVKMKSVDIVDISAPAEFVALFKDFDFVPARCQANRRPQSPEPTPNDNDFLTHCFPA